MLKCQVVKTEKTPKGELVEFNYQIKWSKWLHSI